MEARASMKGQQQPPGKPPTDRPLSRLERFLLLAPRGAEVPGSQSSSGATASRKASSKGAAVSTVKDARAVCLGEEEVTLEDLAAADTLAENVDSPELMWRYLELLFLPQDRRMAQLLREWLRGEGGQEQEDSEDVLMEEEDTGDQSSPSLPELARAEQVMAQSTTIHYSWDWALEDAIAPKEEALRVYSRLGISPPRDIKELNKSFPRVQLTGPDHTFDVRATDRPMRTRKQPLSDPFSAYSPLMPGFMSSQGCSLLQPPPPLPPEGPLLLPASLSASSSSSSSSADPSSVLGGTYMPPESGPTLFSEPAIRGRSHSRDSGDSEPSKNSHRAQGNRFSNMTFRQLYEDLKSTFTSNRELGRYVLHNINANIEAEEERGQSTRGFVRILSEAAASHVIRLEYDHWIDSVEELFAAPEEWSRHEGKIIVVFDDCSSRIRARAIERNVVIQYLRDRQERFMTGFDDIQQFSLTTRTLTSSEETDDVADDDVSVPSRSGETLEGLPDLPQIGPFCHICRQSAKAISNAAAEAARREALGLPPTSLINLDARQKSRMSVCSGVLHDAFEGRPGVTPCHRRFCHTCLVMYSHQLPVEGKAWTCPVCTSSCTCERCTRAEYIKEIRAFALANLGTGRLRDLISRPVDEPREKWRPGCPIPWSQFVKMAPNSSFIIQPDAEVYRQALEIESTFTRKELQRAVKEMKDYNSPGMSTRAAHHRQRQSGRSHTSKTVAASPMGTPRKPETPPWVEVQTPADLASAFLRELVPLGAGPASTEKLLVLRKAVERLREVQKLRLAAAEMLSEREGTLATSLEGSGPQVLARSLLQPLPEWIPTDDLCIKDDDLADEFIMALQRVLPEKRLHHQVMVDDSDTEIEGRPPPEASHARNAVKWRRLARRRGVRKPRSVTLHPGRVRTRTAGDVTDTESMPPHARRGKKKAFDPTAAFGYPIAKRDRIPAAVHYQVMDFV